MKQKTCDLCHDSPAAFVPEIGYRCLACLDAYLDTQPDALAPDVGLIRAAILTIVLFAALGTLAYCLIR